MGFSVLKAWNAILGRHENINSVDNSLVAQDYWIQHAIKVIYEQYGVIVSVDSKNEDLLKFGRNTLVGTSEATIMHQPAGVLAETYVSDNLINSAISNNVADTQELVIKGHTISGGLFTEVSQTVTLNGQSAVALTIPLARVSRVYNNNSTELLGVISITETDTYTAGVPDTNSKVHLQLATGEQQSEKCETTIANDTFWIVTGLYADVLEKTASIAEVHMEARLIGKVFREIIMKSTSNNHGAIHAFKPYYIVPSNSDIRLSAIAGGSNTSISGGIEGVLAKVIG